MEQGRFTYRRGRSRGRSDHPGHGHDVPESSGREQSEMCRSDHPGHEHDVLEPSGREHQGHGQRSDRSGETFHRNRSPDYYGSHGEHSDYYRRHSDRSPDHYRRYETRYYRNRSPDFYAERYYQRSHSPDYHQRWGREECVRSQPADFYDRYSRDYRGSERSRNWSPSSYNREEYRAERDVRSYPLASDQMTTKEEDEIIIDTLMKIYDDCRPEVIRASVEHPENRVKPFDKSVLMERCLLDLRTRSTWRRTVRSGSRPSAALGAPTQTVSASQQSTHLSRESTSSGQVQVSQSVSAPARDADRSRRLGHEGKSSSVLSTDSATSKKPELKWTSKQTSVQSTGSQVSGKSVTSKGSVVSVSSTDAHKSKRSEEPKDQTRKSVSSADSQKPETSKKREHIESEQWTKVSYQKRPKFERYISKKEYSRRIQSKESQSTADKNR